MRPDPNDSFNAAAYLGRALHPLQDWVAHGDFNRWQEAPSLSINSLYYWHNWGKPGWGSEKQPDDPNLDMPLGVNGRATIDKMDFGKTLSNGDRIYYATFTSGNQRIRETERLTKTLLSEFQDHVAKHAIPCGRCWEAFLGDR